MSLADSLKLNFSRVARNSSKHRVYSPLGVCGTFCTLEACAMRGQISAARVTGKVDFQELLETAQTIGFMMIVVSVAYSARFRFVRCVA